MNIAVDTIYSKMISEFAAIDLQVNNRVLAKLKKSRCATICLDELDKQLANNQFYSLETEIEYFKSLRPKFETEQIYYSAAAKMLSNLPPGSKRKKKEYFEQQQNILTNIFCEQSKSFNYVRNAENHQDQSLFVKHSPANNIVSIVLAVERLDLFLIQEKKALKNKKLNAVALQPAHKLNWTGTNTDLVELGYALYHSNTINDGAVTINTILSTLQEVFGRPIKDAPRLFQDLKKRKHATQFLTKLTETLEIKLFE